VNSGNWLSGANYVEITKGELVVRTWEGIAVSTPVPAARPAAGT
jgi:hypothetical protein